MALKVGGRCTVCSTACMPVQVSILVQVFPQNCHEVLHDKDQDKASQLIADWILARCN